MPSALDAIIDGASDPSLRTTDLLRRTIVAATRVRATSVRAWAEKELAGYDGAEVDDLPVYRRPQKTNSKAIWAGPLGSSATNYLSYHDAPEESLAPLFEVTFRQRVAELESFSESSHDGELMIPWPAFALSRWNDLIARNAAVHSRLQSS